MGLYEDLLDKECKLAVIGLGYVGLPLAIEFAKKLDVVAFDINTQRINLYKSGIDYTNDVGDEEVAKSTALFTDNAEDLKGAKFFIVTVQTPINEYNSPDLTSVKAATETVAKYIRKDAVVVYESTVYPGVTEDICVPVIEEKSGLKLGMDFKVGYSPERLNPGDREHRVNNIVKVVSGSDKEALEVIAKVYSLVVEPGVYRASSIKVAEAAKLVENSQRDACIAFVNEVAMVLNRMDIDTHDVIETMNTKWNSLGFMPGLVGGHCIAVDPFYFISQTEKHGIHSQVITAARRTNDNMGRYIAEMTIQQMAKAGCVIKDARIGVLGITFKEDCPDIRNTKVVDIVRRLQDYGAQIMVSDSWADRNEVEKEYNITLQEIEAFRNLDVIILAVSHKEYKELDISAYTQMFKPDIPKILIDVKSTLDKEQFIKAGYVFWRL